jgi:hypothetical protein
MCHVLCSRTQMEDRKNLRAGIDGQPQPQDLCGAAQPRSQFIQLEVGEPQMAEAALVQGLCMFPSARQPCDDGGLTVAENPFGGRWVQPFGQCREHPCDLLRGGFQTVQQRVASGRKGGAAGLTPMCIVCQEGKNPPFFDRQSGLKTKNRARLGRVKAAERSGAPAGPGRDLGKRRGRLR